MKPILYDDLSYIHKRELLLDFYQNNKNISDIIDDMIFNINKKLNINPKYLLDLLVKGYISFEKKFNNKDECIGIIEIDPNTLLPLYDAQTCQLLWIENFHDDVCKRVLYHNQIIHISYRDDDGLTSLSFAEFLYKKYELISPIFYRVIERKIINKFKDIPEFTSTLLVK